MVVLGADALIAARPATAVQLAHACQALGYHAVIPSSWGDELLAGACLDLLDAREKRSAVFCACPRVAHRLLAVGADLAPAMISLVSPPVAVARYLRALYAPSRVRITFVGACPGAGDDTLDARLLPQELFDRFLDHGIVLSAQPLAYESVLPPDRRRFLSVAGGAPAAEVLAARAGVTFCEADANDLAIELTQRLLEGDAQLLDPACHLGCSCAGFVSGLTNGDSRQQLSALEPPRALSPVVDPALVQDLELPLPRASRIAADVAAIPADTSAIGAVESRPDRAQLLLPASAASVPRHSPMRGIPMVPALPAEEPRDLSAMPRRRSPAQGVVLRPAADTPPSSRAVDGRLLPRAYVARRRTGPWRQHPVRPDQPEPPREARED